MTVKRRRAKYLVIVAIAAAMALGIYVASASADPAQLNTCSMCHSGSGVTLKVSLKSSTATTSTYNVAVTGGSGTMGWAVFSGSTNVANSGIIGTNTTSTFTVSNGATYTVYGVNYKTSLTDGRASTTVSPVAPTPTPTPTPTQSTTPTPTPTPTPTQTGVDTTPPVTTSNVVANYTGQAVITLTSTDPQKDAQGNAIPAWGVQYIYYQIDYNPPNSGATHVDPLTPPAFTGTETITIPGPAAGSGLKATHTITYWAQDAYGNLESSTTQTFTISAAKLATSLSVSRSAASVVAGQTFTLSGAVSPAAIGPLTIQYMKPGTSVWRTLGSTMTVSSGKYLYRYHTTLAGTWSFRAVYSGSSTRLNSTSSAVTVKVIKPTLTLLRSPTTVVTGQLFSLSGVITPHASVSVAIQYKKPGTTVWRTLVLTKSSSAGAYLYRYKTTVTGIWSFRVSYAGSYSPTVAVRVIQQYSGRG